MLLALLLFPTVALADSDGDWKLLFSPMARYNHGTVFDPPSDCMLIFGGYGEDYLWQNDLWRIPMSGPADWQEVAVSGPRPPSRIGNSTIYDPVRRRVILYGGLVGVGSEDVLPPYVYNSEVWALTLDGTPTWTQLKPAGPLPPGRKNPAAIYDPVRDRMIVFGGSQDFGTFRDAWALSLNGTPAWTQLADAPLAAGRATAVYDELRDRVVVWQGEGLVALPLAEGSSWTLLGAGATHPSPRYGATSQYDPGSDRMILLGGNSSGATVETWAYSLASGTWSSLEPPGPTPERRISLSSAYDPVRRQLVFTGGTTSSRDVWALPVGPDAPWTRVYVDPPQPPARPDAKAAVLDTSGQRMLLWKYERGTADQLWSLALEGPPVWTRLPISGVGPDMNHLIALHDTKRNRLMVFGYPKDLFVLPLDGDHVWQKIVPASPPSEYLTWGLWTNPTAIYDPIRDRLLIFGGMWPDCRMEGCNPVYFHQLWQIDLGGTPTWSNLSMQGPIPQSEGSAFYDAPRDRMLMYAQQTWQLTLSGTPTWSVLSETTGLSGPLVHDTLRDRLVSYGGPPSKTRAQSPPGAGVWTELEDRGRPRKPVWGVSIYDALRDRMIFQGGDSRLTWSLQWGDGSTAIQVGEEPPIVTSSYVRLSWTLRDSPGIVDVLRTLDGVEWESVAQRSSATGLVSYEDRSIEPGGRYGYAIAWGVGEANRSATTWVQIPATLSLDLTLVSRIDSRDFTLAFTLPSKDGARMELFDVSGRKLSSWEVENLGPGRHERSLNTRSLPSGLYWVRLSQAGEAKTVRAVRIR